MHANLDIHVYTRFSCLSLIYPSSDEWSYVVCGADAVSKF